MLGCRKRKLSDQGWVTYTDVTIGIVIGSSRDDCLVIKVHASLHPQIVDLTRMVFTMKTVLALLIVEQVQNLNTLVFTLKLRIYLFFRVIFMNYNF